MKRILSSAAEKPGLSLREVEGLIRPPFDAPANLFRLFRSSRLTELLRLNNGVKENAGKHMA